MAKMIERGIGVGIHYPIPVHLQEAYSSLKHRTGDFMVAERCGQEFISLPMFPELTEAQVTAVAQALQSSLGPD
jgi:dTDP-4-amino-4,6-dideoxygalactose transaminase